MDRQPQAIAPPGWLRDLRQRFVEVARQRVPAAEVEDIVQEALAVVHQKGSALANESVDGMPPLAWCFQVLRHHVGNYYKRQRTRAAHLEPGIESTEISLASSGATPLEALESQDCLRVIQTAVHGLARSGAQCRRYFEGLIQGQTPRELARIEGLEEAVFYRRLYRCRQHLRELLQEGGLLP